MQRKCRIFQHGTTQGYPLREHVDLHRDACRALRLLNLASAPLSISLDLAAQ
jgi:hypothetical protein